MKRALRLCAAGLCAALLAGCTSAPTPALSPVSPPLTSDAATSAANTPAGVRVLVWDAGAARLSWYPVPPQNAGTTVPTPAPIAEGKSGDRAIRCAERPTDGAFILYTGGQVGTLTLIRPTGGVAPQPLGDGAALACDLDGRTAFSADGAAAASIAYGADAAFGTETASGTLRLWRLPPDAGGSAPALALIIPAVNSFAFAAQGSAGYGVRIVDGGTAVAVFTWPDLTGQGAPPTPRETWRIAASTPACAIVSGQARQVGAAMFLAIGERCTNPAGYQAYVLRLPDSGSAGKAVPSAAPLQVGGRFYPGAGTHRLLLLADGKTLLWLVPDGRRIDTADLYTLDSAPGAPPPIRQLSAVVTDSSPPPGPRRFAFSPDGAFLALVSRAVNNGDTLYLWSMTNPQSEPEQVNDMIRASVVGGVAWSNNGRRLIYVRGGSDPGLSYVDLGGERGDQQRGDYAQALLTPDGSAALAVTGTAGSYAIVRIPLPAGAPETLWTGFSAPPVLLAVR